MNTEFDVEILTPAKTLFAGKATEVVLPAYDGEVGVLAEHSDFIGVLGTGPLKIVTAGDDYWFMLSAGVYQVQGGALTILADVGESPGTGQDVDALNQRLKDLEAKMGDTKSFDPKEYELLKVEHDKVRARLEVYRRTALVN
ncbi:MAG: ATP synthase F1 subunit epsilon [Bdellovibrionota bacterium]